MSDLWLYVAALITVYSVPGPDMVLILQSGISNGRQTAIAVTIGLGIARTIHVILAASGLALIVKTSPWAYDIIKFLGGGYLIYLGVRMLLDEVAKKELSFGKVTQKRVDFSLFASVRKGLLTNLLNPKALLFCSILLPQFVDFSADNVSAQFFVLGTILVLLGLAFDLIYSIGSSKLAKVVTDSGNGVLLNIQLQLLSILLIWLGIRTIGASNTE